MSLPRYTLRQLAYFVAAGDAGSVTLAAERLNVSQPSVSAAILQLEREFGVALFVRHHAQGLSPTGPGEALLVAARDLLRAADDLAQRARGMAEGVAGPLRVGAFRTLSPLILPDLVAGFTAANPAVDLTMVEDDEAELAQRLRRGEIDLALSYAQDAPDIAFESLAELATHVVLAADHLLAREPHLSLLMLAEVPFILLDLPVSRDHFAALFAGAGQPMRVAARSAQPETVRAMVGAGLGFSLMTARPAARIAANGRAIAYVPLAEPAAPMKLGILTGRARHQTRAAAAFAAFCRSRISPAYIPGMA